ncbi:ketopantoate reductase family protein [Falsibacillus albus]|uniref:2-dehydropantoate 2-reductase n=1 Tax=Falsibacillus albus TaxID=2478915 RepID=A0A3L7JS92_9BACI|nr:ketopantoate reductase family protein [Falsibacillus albus]RLQ93350.1 ketopantoate reductase family protein [Falsibacillus albus]
MKLLVVGAGAVGGYFGGRLAEKGEDVTFLVRENRKKQLEESGLIIKSIHGDVELQPKLITASEKDQVFDVIFISTKAYHLDEALVDLKGFVHEDTLILPMLNGISQLEKMEEYFPKDNILGGLCFIEATLNEGGHIVQTSSIHELVFGERSGERTERIERLDSVLRDSGAAIRLSDQIMQEMWHKYLFISTMSGVTSLFRSSIGPIREQEEGRKVMLQLIEEVNAIAVSVNAPVSPDIKENLSAKLTEIGYGMKSSLQRDMEKGSLIEAEHLFGNLLNIAKENDVQTPILNVIYANLKIYEKNLHS